MTAAGVAYCWGSNQRGALGDGTTENRLLPEDVLTGDRFFYSRFEQGRQLSELIGSMADGTTLD